MVGALAEAGIKNVSVFLGSSVPKQYMELVQPTNGATFSDTCSFVVNCTESGVCHERYGWLSIQYIS